MTSVGVLMAPGECVEQRKMRSWLQHLLEKKAADIYRYKGVVAIKGIEQKLLFQGVRRKKG